MNIISFCQENLREIRLLLTSIPEGAYKRQSDILSRATIGQHVRHILEFYTCLIKGSGEGVVNYDRRKRNIETEISQITAIALIDAIVKKLMVMTDGDFSIHLEINFSESSDEGRCRIPSSFHRELAYNLEHSIHHQALIKVGLIEQGLHHLISDSFGVAPATVRFMKESVQK